MVNYCSHCAAKVVGNESHCLQCGTALRNGGGWLGRFLRSLIGSGGSERVEICYGDSDVVSRQEFSVGQKILWSSDDGSMELPDNIPAELMEQFEKSLAARDIVLPTDGFRTVREETYTFKGDDGVERRYESLDEMPADVRARFEGLLRGRFPT